MTTNVRTWRYLILFVALSASPIVVAQQPAPPGLPPLFLREEWRQRDRPSDAPANFVPEAGVTPAAVTNPNLELKLYDPNAKSVSSYEKEPPAGSIARDWTGPACIQLAGYNQNPPPKEVSAGARTDPPNLWTGVCQTAVAATLRDKNNYVDLTGLARIKWVTRVSGFHVVRPVVKLADGTSKVVLLDYDRKRQDWQVRHMGPRLTDVVREALHKRGRVLPDDYDEKYEQPTFRLDEQSCRFLWLKRDVARVEATLILDGAGGENPWRVVYLKYNDDVLVDRSRPST